MKSNSFDYSVLFKNVLKICDKEQLKELWTEYKNANSHTLKEMKNVLHVFYKAGSGSFISKDLESTLSIFNLINNKSDLALNVLNIIANLCEEGNEEVVKEIQSFVFARYSKQQKKLEKFMKSGRVLLSKTHSLLDSIKFCMEVETGSFVYHNNGWGVGEIKSINEMHNEVKIDFEGSDFIVSASLESLNKIVSPISKSHFLVMRFMFSDELEEDALKNQEDVILKALNDIGPLNARELDDLFRGSIISENVWNSWWNRAKRCVNVSEKIVVGSDKKWYPAQDYSQLSCKNTSIQDVESKVIKIMNNANLSTNCIEKESIKTIIQNLKNQESISKSDKFLAEIYANFLGIATYDCDLERMILEDQESFIKMFSKICKPQIKKHVVNALGQTAQGVAFLESIFSLSIVKNSRLDIKELSIANGTWENFAKTELEGIESNKNLPAEFILWLIVKEISDNKNHVSAKMLNDLLSFINKTVNIEADKTYFKKALNVLRKNHYKIVRNVFSECTLKEVRDFISKAEQCNEIVNTDSYTIHSIAEIIFPGMFATHFEKKNENVIWTSRQGLAEAQNQLNALVSKEFIENANDIKKAREYGDLRENAEYSSALDKRRELQSMASRLLSMINNAKCIDWNSVDMDEVSVGCQVDLLQEDGDELVRYIILGPWDIDTDNNIISYATAVAKSMLGKKLGENVNIKDSTYTIKNIRVFSEIK